MWWFFRRKHAASPPRAIAPIVSKQRFQTVRGRRVVADIPYLLPKDLEEINRLDFQHFLLKVALGSLYAAPVKQPATILDVATGSGRWAMEIAQQFPQASVTGFDLVPPPADDAGEQTYDPGARPANYVFVGGDFFAGLPFDDNMFDFVHMRLVYAATPVDKWQPLVNELVRVTKPGGYIELVEGFILIDAGPATNTIQNAIIEANKRRGIDVCYGRNIGPMLLAAGMNEVKAREVHLPLGKRYGRVGTLAEKDILSVFKGIGATVVNSGIVSAVDWNLLYSMMPAEFAESLTTWPVFQAYGRKPLGPIQR